MNIYISILKLFDRQIILGSFTDKDQCIKFNNELNQLLSPYTMDINNINDFFKKYDFDITFDIYDCNDIINNDFSILYVESKLISEKINTNIKKDAIYLQIDQKKLYY